MNSLPKGASEEVILQFVENIISQLSLEEKVAMMSGHGFFESFKRSKGRLGADPYRAGGGCERLGLEPLYFTDGPRGVARGNSTCFPVSMARGASFDVDLERRIGEVIGIEARAQGCDLSGAVCVNLLRHPAWGRAQETYGEDPYHLGEMGAALSEGIQKHNVIATVKHFALNSIENSRFKVDVIVDDRSLREVYLPHFKRIIDSGCASVMSAYNKVNGEYCGQNSYLLTQILRNEWHFDGFVHSDWVKGVYDVSGATAGLDIENPEPLVFGRKLVRAVKEGKVDQVVIDRAVKRILTTQARFKSRVDPLPQYSMDLVACESHRKLAYEAAIKSAVLLKNDNILPLAQRTNRLAVLGRLAGLNNTGDLGSSRVEAPYVVTIYEGLREAMPNMSLLIGDETDVKQASDYARSADAALLVVGYTHLDEGEYIPGDIALDEQKAKARGQQTRGGDRTSLRLPADQVDLIQAVLKVQPRTVVVLVAGSAVMCDPWDRDAGAILQTFYAGMEGGRALVKLLFGDASPSGKLPFSVPQSEQDLPFFDRNADRIEYGLLHGYSLLDKNCKVPAYAFGFGLSYARFKYSDLRVKSTGHDIIAEVAVANMGTCQADEIVQLYIGFPGRDALRPNKLLRGFKRVSLNPGETHPVVFRVPKNSLRWWTPVAKAWVLEEYEHTVFVGGSSQEKDLLHLQFNLRSSNL